MTPSINGTAHQRQADAPYHTRLDLRPAGDGLGGVELLEHFFSYWRGGGV